MLLRGRAGGCTTSHQHCTDAVHPNASAFTLTRVHASQASAQQSLSRLGEAQELMERERLANQQQAELDRDAHEGERRMHADKLASAQVRAGIRVRW